MIPPNPFNDHERSLQPLRVLHGVTGAAGQPSALCRALRQRGVHADSVQIGEGKFSYPSDFHVETNGAPYAAASEFLAAHADNYDIFHLYFRPYFYIDQSRHLFPTFVDLLALKAAGKRIAYHFRGSEVRLHSQFRELSPYNYVDENPHRLISKFPEESMLRLREIATAVSDQVFVTDEELQGYVPRGTIVPRCVDLDSFPFVGSRNAERPLIVHAPTRRAVKGTHYLLRACDNLKSQGLDFDLRMVENQPHHEAIALYRDADIIVDQLRIGWYGVLAVEGMALGKAVVSYVRDDLTRALPDPPPLAVANPDTVEDILKRLIVSVEERVRLGNRGRAFAETTHASTVVAGQLHEHYIDMMQNPRPVDLVPVLEFIEHQTRETASASAKAARTLFPFLESYSVRRLRAVAEYYQENGLVRTIDKIRSKIAHASDSKPG